VKAALRTHHEVLADQLKDPVFRERWQRMALARGSPSILAYRVDHQLSQTQLAKKLGMKQSAIARLEAAEHNPSMETLYVLSEKLGIQFLVDIAPAGAGKAWVTKAVQNADVLGHKVDLNTANLLSRYFRDQVHKEAEVQYVSA
jgi:transcriptional regulator with XRE-family HTH domain